MSHIFQGHSPLAHPLPQVLRFAIRKMPQATPGSHSHQRHTDNMRNNAPSHTHHVAG